MKDFFNCNITLLDVFKHHWTQNKFSYMENPRPDYGILLVLNGKIDFTCNGETLCTKKGDIIFLPKSCYYEALFRKEFGEIDNYLINFELENENIFYTKPMKIAENVSFSLIEAFDDFFKTFYNEEKISLSVRGHFYLLLDYILKEAEKPDTHYNTMLEKAVNLLLNENEPSISEIARKCNVSESGFRRLFKEHFGISPAGYRMERKLNKARYLLESTDMSVEEIADKLKFYDAAYFCRKFRSFAGITPKKYSQSKKL